MICLDEDVVDELVVDEAGDPERIVTVDTSELVDDLDVSTGEDDTPLCLEPLCIFMPLLDVDS